MQRTGPRPSNRRDGTTGVNLIHFFSKPVGEEPRKPFGESLAYWAMLPLRQGDLVGILQVFAEGRLHLPSEAVPHDDHVDLLVVEEAPHIHVGGADRGPTAVDDGGLGVQHRTPEFMDLDAGLQHLGVEGAPGMGGQPAIGDLGQNDLHVHAAFGISQASLTTAFFHCGTLE